MPLFVNELVEMITSSTGESKTDVNAPHTDVDDWQRSTAKRMYEAITAHFANLQGEAKKLAVS